MAKTELEIDVSQLEQMIAELGGTGDTTLTRSVVSALRSVARKAGKRTYRNFSQLSSNPKKRRRKSAKGRLADDPINLGRKGVLNGKLVTIKRLKDPKPLIYIGIRGNWKAKFFELGTKERYTKNLLTDVIRSKRKMRAFIKYLRGEAPSRGKITEGRYFKRALDETTPELQQAILEALNKAITRAYTKLKR